MESSIRRTPGLLLQSDVGGATCHAPRAVSVQTTPSSRPGAGLWLSLSGVVLVVVVVAQAMRPSAPSAHASEAPSTPTPALAPLAMTLGEASGHVSIEMYSAAWCSACGRAKAWMREQGIRYREIDVDHGQGAMAQLQMLNPRRTLPTFDVGGEVLVGFAEPQLASAINSHARAR
jgi:glutaredoxin